MLTTIINAGVGAYGAAEFGKKGVLAGAALGIGADKAGKMIASKVTGEDEDRLGGTGAFIHGFTAGSMQSAFSSAQELHAFNRPGSVQALSSINSTTSATSQIDTMRKYTNPEYLKGIGKASKDAELSAAQFMMQDTVMQKLRPEDIVVDIARNGMIRNIPLDEELAQLTKVGYGKDAKSGIPDIMKQFGKNRVDEFKETVNLGDNNGSSDWFQTDKTITMPQEEFIRTYEDGTSAKYMLNEVTLDPLDSMSDRTAKYLERHANMLDGEMTIIDKSGKERVTKSGVLEFLSDMSNSDITNSDDLVDYVKGIKPGAYGTYSELDKRVYSNGTTKDKILGAAYENQHGSPLWARALDKEIKDGSATIKEMVNVQKANGDMVDVLKSDIRGGKYKLDADDTVKGLKNVIEGGSKLKRGIALAGDIAMGGAVMGAMFAVPALLSSGISRAVENDKKTTNTNMNRVKSNLPVNAI